MKYFKSFYYLFAILVIGVTFVPATVSAQSDVNKTVFQAIRSSDLKMLNHLVVNGADINETKYHGYTLLMEAAKLGDIEIVSFLLDNNATVDAQNQAGGTALMLAAKYGHSNLVKKLLEYGADPVLTNNSGKKPIDFAKAFDKKATANILRQAERKLTSTY